MKSKRDDIRREITQTTLTTKLNFALAVLVGKILALWDW